MTDVHSSHKTGVVAFFLGYNPGPLEPFPSIIISGLISRLYNYQKRLLVVGSPFSDSVDDLYTSLTSNGIEGLIFVPPSDPSLAEKLSQSGFPAVALADRAPGIVSVVVDNEMGAFMLAEHLMLRGHRKVLYRKDLSGHESGIKRFMAFKGAAEYHHMEVIETFPTDYYGSVSKEEEAYLSKPKGQRPTAVVSWVDSYAQPVLKYCKAHGLMVPKDISVAGFDGIPFPVETTHRLTTVQAPWLRVAEKSADLLIHLINGESVPQETVLPVDLMIGDTT